MSIYIYTHTHAHIVAYSKTILTAIATNIFSLTSSIKILHHNAISKQFQLYLCNLLMWYMVMTWGWFVADPTLPWPSRRAPPRLPSTSSGVLRDPRS